MDVNERLEQLLSNNLANQETPGFKESLGELMEDPVQNMEHVSYGSGASGTYIGQMGTGVVFQEGVPVFSEGAVQMTGRPLDLAIIDSVPAGPMAYVQGATGAQRHLGRCVSVQTIACPSTVKRLPCMMQTANQPLDFTRCATRSIRVTSWSALMVRPTMTPRQSIVRH
ncbi:hypothetical protein GCM10025858_20720 [Alicyclobacillus sacchari]|nr:hypothetical protein GCM10025858_20720 [Alicyclobacillus sacchari]